MSGIKIIRNYFGLTQTELSVFLDVSGSMLRMAETNKRILPTHALVKLSLLDAQMQKPQARINHKAAVPHVKIYTAHYTKQIDGLHKQLQYKTAQHKKKIDTMQKRYGQALQSLALVHALQQKSTRGAADKKDIAWLQLIGKKAGVALKNANPILQAHAQIKMDILHREAAALQTILQKIQ
jgi:hypothetical protein